MVYKTSVDGGLWILFRCIFQNWTKPLITAGYRQNASGILTGTCHLIYYIMQHLQGVRHWIIQRSDLKQAQIYSQRITKCYKLQISWPDALVHTGLYYKGLPHTALNLYLLFFSGLVIVNPYSKRCSIWKSGISGAAYRFVNPAKH